MIHVNMEVVVPMASTLTHVHVSLASWATIVKQLTRACQTLAKTVAPVLVTLTLTGVNVSMASWATIVKAGYRSNPHV